MKTIVGCYIDGITINPPAYLMENSAKLMCFDSETAARWYLAEKGFTTEDMDNLLFQERSEEEIADLESEGFEVV